MSSGMSFSSSSNALGGMSYAQFSPGLGQIMADLNSGKLAKDILSDVLSSKASNVSFAGAASSAFSGIASAGAGTAGVTGSSNITSGGATSTVSGAGASTIGATATASLTVPITRQVEVSRMVTIPTEKKVMVPTTRQVPDMANAGKLETKGNEITTPGGYKVKLEGDTAYVTAPNGKQIKVWGDPHITHTGADGKQQNIDFRKGTTSFALPDGTRITMNAYNDKGQLAANGFLGKVDVYNGNKHVTLDNGRQQTGKTGTVQSSGVKNDGLAAAAKQDAGDTLHVVGDGSQLAYKGHLTKHESVSGTVRKGEWSTGAMAGTATVGAQALQVPMKTITEFKEVTQKGFEQKLVKEMKTITEMQTFTHTAGGSASASVGASATAGTAFDINGGFGGFSTNSFGNNTLGSVGGAMGGAGLYGNFVNSGASYYSSHFGSQSSSRTPGFPFNSIADYLSSASNSAMSVFNSFNQSISSMSHNRYAAAGNKFMF